MELDAYCAMLDRAGIPHEVLPDQVGETRVRVAAFPQTVKTGEKVRVVDVQYHFDTQGALLTVTTVGGEIKG